MVSNFHLPPTGFGPGSQPDAGDGEELEFMAMPSGMRTYSSHLPEIDEIDADVGPALALLADLSAACAHVAENGGARVFDLKGFDAENRKLIAETMGEGEVSMKIRGVPARAVQESVFAGVWMSTAQGEETIEVAAVPRAVAARAFVPIAPAVGALAPRNPQIVNAPALLAEIMDKSAAYTDGAEPHVINLTLLPHTEGDLAWLDTALGQGSVDILSRGYGNCRVQSTALPHTWRVRFYNSMDALILDTFEIGPVPEVALAATEDLRDSAERLAEVLEAIR